MKKVVVIVFLIGIFLGSIAIYTVSYLDYLDVKNNNDTINEKIKKISNKNNSEEKNTITLRENISKLEKDLSEEIKIYNEWQQLKEKLTSSLSS